MKHGALENLACSRTGRILQEDNGGDTDTDNQAPPSPFARNRASVRREIRIKRAGRNWVHFLERSVSSTGSLNRKYQKQKDKKRFHGLEERVESSRIN